MLLSLLCLPILIVNCNGNNDSTLKGDSIEFKHGVAIQKGKALYIDPSKMGGVGKIAFSEAYIDKISEPILKGSHIYFIGDEQIYLLDSRKANPYFELFETKRQYFYKIEGHALYVSQDKKTWDKVTVRIVNMDHEESRLKDADAPIYMTIYIECKYFNGEYDLIGTTG